MPQTGMMVVYTEYTRNTAELTSRFSLSPPNRLLKKLMALGVVPDRLMMDRREAATIRLGRPAGARQKVADAANIRKTMY